MTARLGVLNLHSLCIEDVCKDFYQDVCAILSGSSGADLFGHLDTNVSIKLYVTWSDILQHGNVLYTSISTNLHEITFNGNVGRQSIGAPFLSTLS
jgi:hypothetical protein